jgi:exosome complex component RRP42
MAPSATQQVLLSPAELSYLHTSLSFTPPIRPDARTCTQFRPLIAETDILPGTNGSARICFADGTEAIVGIKAEVENSGLGYQAAEDLNLGDGDENEQDEATGENEDEADAKVGLNEWVDLTVEIPGFRDDDSMPIFLAAMMSEALLADGEFTRRLWINRRFHWKLYLDVSQRLCITIVKNAC